MKILPRIHSNVFIAEGAKIVGDVEIEAGSSVWFNAVIRGDEGKVRIGKHVNVQDMCVVHSDRGMPLSIGDYVTIGHGAVIRSCTIGSHSMIGMNATVLYGSQIGKFSILGAGSLLPENRIVPEKSLAIGIPAKVARKLEDNELRMMREALSIYKDVKQQYAKGKILGSKA